MKRIALGLFAMILLCAAATYSVANRPWAAAQNATSR